jgi:hypothetical protein
VVDKIVASLATVEGNQGQLTVAINRLQLEKLLDIEKADASSAGDTVTNATRHNHMLLFRSFDGTEDLLPWLNHCEQFFRIQETSEDDKVFLATFYMTGDASQWYTLLERNHRQPSWDEFTRLVNKCFGPPLWGNALGELIQLRREGFVADYQTKFLSLLAWCEDHIEKHQINIFTARLWNPFQTNIKLENPETLDDAMAWAYEKCLPISDDPPVKLASTRAIPACLPRGSKSLLLLAPPSAQAPRSRRRRRSRLHHASRG